MHGYTWIHTAAQFCLTLTPTDAVVGATARVHQLPAGCTTHSETTTEPSMMQWVMLMDARSFANNDDETMPSQTRARAPTCWEPSKRHVAFAGTRLIVLTRIVLAEHPMPSPAALVFSFFWASQRQSYPSVSSGCCQYRDCFRGTSARRLSHAISRLVCRGPYRHLSFVERAYSPSAARRSHIP